MSMVTGIGVYSVIQLIARSPIVVATVPKGLPTPERISLRLLFILLVATAATFIRSAEAQDRVDPFQDPAFEILRLTPEVGPEFPLPRQARLTTVAVAVNSNRLAAAFYRLDSERRTLWIEPAVLDTAQILQIAFRQLPFATGQVYSVTSDSVVTPHAGAVEPTQGSTAGEAGAPMSIVSRGSVTRGVSAGSNRDVGIESGLRVELAGEVAPGVNMRAVLNDENTPILPDGTTRRLEDFDRVFIELDSRVGRAQLGDISIGLQASEFARITRHLQGVAIQSNLGLAAETAISGDVLAAGAISRGRFRSMEIQVLDGVQGPYRLTGSDGERLILVVPGSERIYWDGGLLQRGDDADYVLDYATGELYFTSRRIVTDERRVLAEFEYSTNQFTRTLVATQGVARFLPTQTGHRFTLGATVIREADGSQFLDEFGLSREDSLALAQAGAGQAIRSGAEVVPFDPEASFVQYVWRLIDPVTQDSGFVALSFPPDPGEPVFRVRFSHVGTGAGSYDRTGEAVNGIAYRYVGAFRGAYEPVRVLPRPSSHQVLSAFGEFRPVDNFLIYGELSGSDLDVNRLSDPSLSARTGAAYLAGVRILPVRFGEAVTLEADLRRRRVGSDFAPFDRIRPVEFERRWNIATGATAAPSGFSRDGEEVDEFLASIGLGELARLRVEAGRLTLGEVFSGRRLASEISARPRGLPHVQYLVEVIGSNEQALSRGGSWLRQRGIVEYAYEPFGLTPLVEFEHEDRRMRPSGSDSLLLESFDFVRIAPGVRWVMGDHGAGGATVSIRANRDALRGSLEPSSRSVTSEVSHLYTPSARLSTELRLGHRRRTYTDAFRALGRADQSSLLVQASTRWRPHLRGAEILTSYDATGDRTPLLQEVFVRVGPEFGHYVWEDFNGDGVIQPEEMIPERSPNEGVYARTLIPSDSLIATSTVSARAQVRLDGAAISETTALPAFLSQLALRSVFEVVETTRDPDLTRIYLLYLTRYRNPFLTVNGRLRIDQEISLFPRSRVGTVDMGYSRVETMNTRTGGREDRLIERYRAEGRLRAIRRISLRTEIMQERNRQESAVFVTRRFDIHATRVEPEITSRITDRFSTSLRLPLAWKSDVRAERSAFLFRTPVELRYQVPSRMSLSGRAEVAHVRLDGTAIGLAEFELTDGRGPGTSYLWGIQGQYHLNEYLRATLQYDGRLPDGLSAIHTMRMQLSAVF